MHYKLLALFFLQFSCLISIFGQTDTLDISPTIDMDQVVISVTKTQQSHSRIAQEVKVINRSQILLMQAQNTADLLQQTSSVSIQKSQQGGGSAMLRGFEANRVLMMVDGVRLNNAIYRSGHLQNILTMDNNIMERVEVLYGPSSTIYGSDALGGVIHFYTRKPKHEDLSGGAFARYSSINKEKTGHLHFNIGNDKWASLSSFTYSSFEDLKMGKRVNPFLGRDFGLRYKYVTRINGIDTLITNSDPYIQVQSGYNQYDVLQKISFTPTDKIAHTLNFQLSNTTNIPRYDRLTDTSSTTGLNQAQWYYGPQFRLMLAYDMKYQQSTTKTLSVNVNYQDIQESRHTRIFGNNSLASRVEDLSVWGLSIDQQTAAGNHNIRYGLDAQINNLLSNAKALNIATGVISNIDTRYPDGNNTMAQLGAYISHSWQASREISVSSGGRFGYSFLKSTFVSKEYFPFPYDKVEQQTPVFSANLGAVFKPNYRSKYSVGLSSGFRVPNIDDVAKVFESSATKIIVPNVNLGPEKTINIEVNSIKYFTDHLRWQASLYKTWLFDAIIVDSFNFNGSNVLEYNGNIVTVLANQNKRRAEIQGISTDFNYQLTSIFTVDARMQYNIGTIKNTNGNLPLDHIAPLSGRFGLAFQGAKINATFYSIFNGWKRIKEYNPEGEDNQQYAPVEGMPAWVTYNLKCQYGINKTVRLLLGIENILDTQYRTFASGINAAGRNYSFTGNISF